MRPRVLTALALLAVGGASSHAQTTTAPPPRPVPAPVIIDGLIFQYAPAPATRASPPGSAPAPVYTTPRPTPAAQVVEYAQPARPVAVEVRPSTQPPQVSVRDLPLDSLVAELKGIQAQKDVLAKREADVAKEVRRRLEEYTRALDKLGHGPVRLETPQRSVPSVVPTIHPPATTTSPPVSRRGTTDETTTRTRQTELPALPPPPAPEPLPR